MIIFFSTCVSDVSEHLRNAVVIGPIGIYRGQDDRAVQQAAALTRVNVFVLNTFLVRLSILEVVSACLIMAFTPYTETAFVILFVGYLTAISLNVLDKIWGKSLSIRR